MGRRVKATLIAIIVLAIVALTAWYLRGVNIPILEPKGLIGQKEKNLIIFTVLLGLVVVIPVFVMAIVIAWRYREGNTKAKYTPDWDRNRVAEFTWWAIPIMIISILSVVVWTSSHDLDPSKPLDSSVKPMTIQVVALNWKWLFIYPDQGIATVNYVQFPINTPVNFQITADAPMNSFWIPQLGGQIYAMPGMATQLNLTASTKGDYDGSSANISGSGFAGMKFIAKASSRADYTTWVQLVKQSSHNLTLADYNSLAIPSQNVAPIYYATSASNLFEAIQMKYMMPTMKPGMK